MGHGNQKSSIQPYTRNFFASKIRRQNALPPKTVTLDPPREALRFGGGKAPQEEDVAQGMTSSQGMYRSREDVT
jgi:hypothetical protein